MDIIHYHFKVFFAIFYQPQNLLFELRKSRPLGVVRVNGFAS